MRVPAGWPRAEQAGAGGDRQSTRAARARRRAAAALAAALGACALGAGAAHAQSAAEAPGAGAAHARSAADVAAARDLFIEGSRLAERDLWADARDRFARSLALKRSALTLYSLGVAQRNTGNLVEALESFRAFLAEPSAQATRPYEAPARKAVEALSRRIARIDVRIEPAEARSATVRVDGVPVPAEALGEARAVNPGRRVVTATAAGFRPARVEVVLVEGEHASVRLVLERAPMAPAAAPAPAAGGPAPVDGAVRAGAAGEGAGGGASRVVPFTLLGAGAVLVGAGAALGLAGVNDASHAPARDGPDADRARALALAGDVLAGVGLATAAAGAIVLAARPSRAPASAASLQVWIGAGSAGLRGRF